MSKGGLAFLNKKSWHTQSIKMIETVWKAEEKHRQEQKKLAELAKEKEEERQVEELRRLQAHSGLVSKSSGERLDWMYHGAAATNTQEEYLMGKEYKPKDEEVEVKKLQESKAAGSMFLNKKVNVELEEANRLRDDPLLAIMKAEQQQRHNIIANPVKMEDIKNRAKLLKRLKKKMKKEKKKHKKKHKHRDRSSSASRSRSRSPPSRKSRSHRRHSRSRSRSRERDAKTYGAPVHELDRSLQNKVNKYGLIHTKAVERSPDREKHHSHSRKRSRSRSRRRSRSRSRGGKRSRSGRDHHHRSDHRSRSRRSRSRSPRSHKPPTSTSRAPPRGAPRPAARPRRQPLTAEEKAARLRAMQADAEVHEKASIAKLKHDDKVKKQEEEAFLKRDEVSSQSASFIRSMNKDIYSGKESLEERLKKNAHYRQKGEDALRADTFL